MSIQSFLVLRHFLGKEAGKKESMPGILGARLKHKGKQEEYLESMKKTEMWNKEEEN